MVGAGCATIALAAAGALWPNFCERPRQAVHLSNCKTEVQARQEGCGPLNHGKKHNKHLCKHQAHMQWGGDMRAGWVRM
eukprot:1148495-Pelagomonas_calceolata.AAC.7